MIPTLITTKTFLNYAKIDWLEWMYCREYRNKPRIKIANIDSIAWHDSKGWQRLGQGAS